MKLDIFSYIEPSRISERAIVYKFHDFFEIFCLAFLSKDDIERHKEEGVKV